MSRLGKISVAVPKNVKVTIDGQTFRAEGPKGKLSLDIPLGIKVEQKEGNLMVQRFSDSKQVRANHGTIRALLVGLLEGVGQGHKRELEIQGVGFRALIKGDVLSLNLGFSHPVDFQIPKAVKVSLPQPTQVVIEGMDKALVGQVAASIRDIKPPEPYKGKGIRYLGEPVRRKQGKSVTK